MDSGQKSWQTSASPLLPLLNPTCLGVPDRQPATHTVPLVVTGTFLLLWRQSWLPHTSPSGPGSPPGCTDSPSSPLYVQHSQHQAAEMGQVQAQTQNFSHLGRFPVLPTPQVSCLCRDRGTGGMKA